VDVKGKIVIAVTVRLAWAQAEAGVPARRRGLHHLFRSGG